MRKFLFAVTALSVCSISSLFASLDNTLCIAKNRETKEIACRFYWGEYHKLSTCRQFAYDAFPGANVRWAVKWNQNATKLRHDADKEGCGHSSEATPAPITIGDVKPLPVGPITPPAPVFPKVPSTKPYYNCLYAYTDCPTATRGVLQKKVQAASDNEAKQKCSSANQTEIFMLIRSASEENCSVRLEVSLNYTDRL